MVDDHYIFKYTGYLEVTFTNVTNKLLESWLTLVRTELITVRSQGTVANILFIQLLLLF